MHMGEQISFDTQVRLSYYQDFVETGRSPSARRLAEILAVPEAGIRASLERLYAGKVLVLQQESREVMIAHPLSAIPTPHAVYARSKMFFATCAWDALGVFALLEAGGIAETSCPCCGESMTIKVADGHPLPAQGLLHFALPARDWWQNIVFT